MTFELGILLITLVLLAVLIAFVIYYSKVTLSTKLLILPIVIGIIYSIMFQVERYSGYAKNQIPTEEFIYVYHEISLDRSFIKLWIVESTGDKLYLIPYSRELAVDLANSYEKRKQGAVIIGHFSSSEGYETGKSGNTSATLELEEVSIETFQKGE